MMRQILNAVRREVALMMQNIATVRMGIVDSYDPVTHTAKVKFQPDDTLSGWLPIGSARVGVNCGLVFAPNIGDQVEVRFLEGVHEAGVIGLRFYSDQDPPPNVPAGESWFINEQGSGWKFHNDGSGEITTTAALTVTAPMIILTGETQIGAPGGKKVALDGDPVVGGVIQASSTMTKAT